MTLRFVTQTVHAYLDYPVAAGLMAMPFILPLGASGTLAVWLSVATGIAAFVLTVFTDHKLSVVPIIPFAGHLIVDFLVGITFALAPTILGFSGIDAWYYWINGAAVIAVVSLHQPLATRGNTAPA